MKKAASSTACGSRSWVIPIRSTGTVARVVTDSSRHLLSGRIDPCHQKGVPFQLISEFSQPYRQGDEALLGAVMEVAFQAPTLKLFRFKDPDSRAAEFLQACL
jgi:hypothetical protein